jgi:hypothetical protein
MTLYDVHVDVLINIENEDDIVKEVFKFVSPGVPINIKSWEKV